MASDDSTLIRRRTSADGQSARRVLRPRHQPAQAVGRWTRRIALGFTAILLSGSATLVGVGFVVEGAQPPLESSDAIIVISGDENQARLRAGLQLWRARWAPRLIFSGAAREGPTSNAEAMRQAALLDGVPARAILVDSESQDTFGNAVFTRRLMESSGLHSAILVTSPYHLQRATLTFNGVYRGSDIRVLASAAPDSDWRKQSWWTRSDLRMLTLTELEKLSYIAVTGRFN
jgi:uncharacterized SAM-binding protein YcdF (DUF218 family)